MNAMYERLRLSFPTRADDEGADERHEMVGLQHGRSLLSLYRRLLNKYGANGDSQYSPKQAEAQARWIKNLTKLNYPPVRIFSPYQMLKSFYRLKGYETMLADYYDAAFIFDEIHAYDVKRLALILKSVEYLARNYNARFLLMSATFPQLIKEQLRIALGPNLPEIHAAPALYERFQRHTLRLRDGELTDPAIMAEIEERIASKQLVLICVNTVKRAQALYKQLANAVRQRDGDIVLLHGRFNGRDRLVKEKRIKDATDAKNEQVREHGLLVVATQAIEVSLDIDLDVIYTDPAPLEALVQRFGRVNRRGNKGLADVFVFREPADGQHVYSEDLVCATLKIVAREQDKPIDESKVGAWLDEIYDGEIADRWRKEYQQTANDFQRAVVETLRPFQSDEEIEGRFDDLFEGTELLPACFEAAYNQMEAEGSIDASALLVPISNGQYWKLRGKEGIRDRQGGEKKWPRVAEAPYSDEYGLDLESDGE